MPEALAKYFGKTTRVHLPVAILLRRTAVKAMRIKKACCQGNTLSV
jgi:hypothetical protein